LKDILYDRFGVNIFADNDSNVSALAESYFGDGIGINNFVLYSIGEGIGAGVVIDGMLYRGEDNVVAEIGHATVDYKGETCICGNVGCLELYTSFSELLRRYQINGTNCVNEISEVFHLANSGNVNALSAITEEANLLSIGAVSLANIFSPELIIIGTNDIGDIDIRIIVDNIQENIRNKAFSVIADKIKVKQSKLGSNIQLLGGVALVLQDYFSSIKQ
jgi:glucokinase